LTAIFNVTRRDEARRVSHDDRRTLFLQKACFLRAGLGVWDEKKCEKL
jgi:hypothetical protein